MVSGSVPSLLGEVKYGGRTFDEVGLNRLPACAARRPASPRLIVLGLALSRELLLPTFSSQSTAPLTS